MGRPHHLLWPMKISSCLKLVFLLCLCVLTHALEHNHELWSPWVFISIWLTWERVILYMIIHQGKNRGRAFSESWPWTAFKCSIWSYFYVTGTWLGFSLIHMVGHDCHAWLLRTWLVSYSGRATNTCSKLYIFTLITVPVSLFSNIFYHYTTIHNRTC